MADELQALLERLDKEGVRKGEEERERLVSQAKAEAAQILAQAEEKAEAMVGQAQTECQTLRQKAEDSIRQSGRQVLLQVRQELKERVEGAVRLLLKSELKPGVVGGIVAQLCQGYLREEGRQGNLAVLVPEASLKELEEAVRASLGAELLKRVSLKPDKRLSGGFQLSVQGEEVLYDFTDEALAEAIAAHLSPALGALITP